MKEKLIKKRRIYSGKVLDFYVDKVLMPDKKTATREYTSHPGAVAVIPFLPGDKKIILVKQYRYPVNKITYEIPAGKLSRGENIVRCAKRELEEETGYTSNNFRKMMSFYPSTAFSTEILHIFVAHNLRKTVSRPDDDEFIKIVTVEYDYALEMVKSGKISDSKSIIGLLYFRFLL